MPVVESQVFLQVAIVFGLIGLLGLVLRWTFRNDARPFRSPAANARTVPTEQDRSTDATTPSVAAASLSGAATRSGQREDFGLLAVAAEVSTPEDVANIRRLLTAAGIRSTSAETAGGKYKVLVFGDQLIRARRVAGGSQGAGGSTSGTGGS